MPKLIAALIILALSIALVAWAIGPYLKDNHSDSLPKKNSYILLASLPVIAISGWLFQSYINDVSFHAMSKTSSFLSCLCLALVFLMVNVVVISIILLVHKPTASEKETKWYKVGSIAPVGVIAILLLLLMESISKYLTYPLVSGFAIDSNGFHWFNELTKVDYEGAFCLSFYGLIIVSGALLVLGIIDNRFYKKYGKRGMMDSTFLVAFPAGIIGARIWYVVGNWHRDGFDTDFLKVFKIWGGGLTIIGGAVFGILVGVLFVIFAVKEVNVRWAVDAIVPTILIAQAIGRWGNFFNMEVYGGVVKTWEFLPSWMIGQMSYDCPPGYMNVPLFLIEGIINILGFVVITYLVPLIWKKHRPLGSIGACYLIWYGIVRFFLEPLRNPEYNMGMNGLFSVFGSAGMILLGALAIAAFFLIDWYTEKKKLNSDNEQ